MTLEYWIIAVVVGLVCLLAVLMFLRFLYAIMEAIVDIIRDW